MKNRIMNKLRSRTGASITFALLLFIVCAVLCSVILAASTAAAGRMSKIAEVDQRYYAVTSAAELLIDDFKKTPTVSVVETVVTEYNTTYTSGGAGEPQVVGEPVKTVITQITDNMGNTVDGNLDTIKSIQEDAAKKVYEETASGITARELHLTSSFTGMAYDPLAVTIQEKLDEDGSITLTLFNTNNSKGSGSSAGERYTMVLSFGANKSVNTGTKTENLSVTPLSAGSYQIKSRTTKVTTTKITWMLTGIKTNPKGEVNGG